MFRGKRILALIPARGGSKGLPGKNARLFLGRPLISWSIKQANASKYIDRVVVSSEDKKILHIAGSCGADTSFTRPRYLARDSTPMIDVVMHTIKYLKKAGEYYDLIILLQPTSPLRRVCDIDKSIELLFSKKAQAIVSVSDNIDNPNWANTLPRDNCMKNFLKAGVANKNRQDSAVFYGLNGAIFLAYSKYLLIHKTFFGACTYAYIMPKQRSVDIDDEVDFYFAEFLLKAQQQGR